MMKGYPLPAEGNELSAGTLWSDRARAVIFFALQAQSASIHDQARKRLRVADEADSVCLQSVFFPAALVCRSCKVV